MRKDKTGRIFLALILIPLFAIRTTAQYSTSSERPDSVDNPKGSTTKMQTCEINGGQSNYGCLGSIVGPFGKILKIYPESDLNRLEIKPGDKIIEIDGHRFNYFNFQKQCVGLPGSSIDLNVIHTGYAEKFSVLRVDSRNLSAKGSYYKKLSTKVISW
jgi:hypothetical protein